MNTQWAPITMLILKIILLRSDGDINHFFCYIFKGKVAARETHIHITYALIYISAKEVMFLCWLIGLFVCQQDHVNY